MVQDFHHHGAERYQRRQHGVPQGVHFLEASVPLQHAVLAVEQQETADHGFKRLLQRGLGLRDGQAGLGHAVHIPQRQHPGRKDHGNEQRGGQRNGIALFAPVGKRRVQRDAGRNAQVLVQDGPEHQQRGLARQSRRGLPGQALIGQIANGGREGGRGHVFAVGHAEQ